MHSRPRNGLQPRHLETPLERELLSALQARGERRREQLVNTPSGPEDLIPDPFVGRIRQSTMFRLPLAGDAGTETDGRQRMAGITVYVLERPAGAYGTVQMPESRGHGIAPRFRSIAAYRR